MLYINTMSHKPYELLGWRELFSCWGVLFFGYKIKSSKTQVLTVINSSSSLVHFYYYPMVIETRRSKSIIRFAQVVAAIVLVYVTLQTVISAGENLVLFTRTNSSFSNDLNPRVLFHQTQILFNNISKSPASAEKKCMNPVQRQKTFSTNFSPFKITFNWTNLWFSKSLTSFSLEKNSNLKLGPSDNVVNKTDVDLLLKSFYPPFHHRKFFEKAACQRCVVVGNGPCLREKNLGPLIDQFPIVIRDYQKILILVSKTFAERETFFVFKEQSGKI